MPFKIIRPPESVARLSGFSLLGFTGPEAGTFLQAQLMNDVALLVDGQWQWNGWLNPKGRLIAFFALLRVTQGEFIAVLPDFPAIELQAMLQRFVFRSKVTLAPVNSLVAGSQMDSTNDHGRDDARDRASGAPDGGFCLDFSGQSVRRALWILPSGKCAAPDSSADATWLAQDLAHGLPRLSAAQREAWTPQMLSLDRLRAFSLRKGCYPGQEIVARTHYLGQARREAAHITGRDLAEGLILLDSAGGTLGSVLSATLDGAAGLAVIRADQTGDAVTLSGTPVAVSALIEGMQRPV